MIFCICFKFYFRVGVRVCGWALYIVRGYWLEERLQEYRDIRTVVTYHSKNHI